MKVFFDELVQKVQAHLTELAADRPLPEGLRQVQTICNPNVCPTELLLSIFAQTLFELLDCVARTLARGLPSGRRSPPKATSDSQRALLQLYYLLLQATHLKTDSLDTLDFCRIYEQEKHLSDEELWGEFIRESS